MIVLQNKEYRLIGEYVQKYLSVMQLLQQRGGQRYLCKQLQRNQFRTKVLQQIIQLKKQHLVSIQRVIIQANKIYILLPYYNYSLQNQIIYFRSNSQRFNYNTLVKIAMDVALALRNYGNIFTYPIINAAQVAYVFQKNQYAIFPKQLIQLCYHQNTPQKIDIHPGIVFSLIMIECMTMLNLNSIHLLMKNYKKQAEALIESKIKMIQKFYDEQLVKLVKKGLRKQSIESIVSYLQNLNKQTNKNTKRKQITDCKSQVQRKTVHYEQKMYKNKQSNSSNVQLQNIKSLDKKKILKRSHDQRKFTSFRQKKKNSNILINERSQKSNDLPKQFNKSYVEQKYIKKSYF